MLTCKQMILRQGRFTLAADLAFVPGHVTALIGPSGAGKSTLLAALAGFLAPVEGQISWQGQDITHVAPGARPISVLFQDNNLFPHLTLAQNVGLALRPSLRLRRAEKQQVAEALAQVGLADFAARKPGALSGGQQSRGALARVLLADRPVVLLDEPFAALGPGLKDDMLDLVQSQLKASKRSLIMVTHDPADAKRIADDVVLVADGVAAKPVATAEVFANPPQALAAYLGRA